MCGESGTAVCCDLHEDNAYKGGYEHRGVTITDMVKGGSGHDKREKGRGKN